MSVKTQSGLFLENVALQRENIELRVKLMAYEPWDSLAISADSKQHFIDKHNNTKREKGQSINERKARIAFLEDSMKEIRDNAKTKMKAIAQKKSVRYVVQKTELVALQGLVKIDEEIAASILASEQELWQTQALLKQQQQYAKFKHSLQTMQAKGTLNVFSLPSLEQVMPPLPASRPPSARSSPLLAASSSSRPTSPIAPSAPSSTASASEISPSLSSTSSSSSPPPIMTMRERKSNRKRKLKQETIYVDDEAMESTPEEIATEKKFSKYMAKLDEDSCSSDSTDEEQFTDATDTDVVQEALGAYEAAMAAQQS